MKKFYFTIITLVLLAMVSCDEVSREEMRYTVDTYKKLQMQNEAKKYLNKVEKLVNPGIDFIMELQRVIEE